MDYNYGTGDVPETPATNENAEVTLASEFGATYSLSEEPAGGKKPRRILGMPRGLFIFLCILLGALLLALGIYLFADDGDSLPDDDYIAILPITGTIGADPSTGYDHKWLLKMIDELEEDDDNQGIMLYMNTPGGRVYEGDELYLKLLEYKDVTDRPLYAYFANQSCSCGYYIACASDCIIANRNTLTGSIGVKVGTFLDISKLMEKYGVKAFDITTGEFKTMGSEFEEMSKEERKIWQAYIDESFDRFVEAIVDGRDLDEETVRKLADGRIYTAKQAYELGMIDDIAGFDDAKIEMLDQENLDCDFQRFDPVYEELSIWDIIQLLGSAKKTDNLGSLGSGFETATETEHYELYSLMEGQLPSYE